jgi:F0F1-type ATP synthase membrane subunit b/b'
MSDLMLLGILRMPLDDTPEGLGVIAWTQIKSVMREAANRIEADAARIAELEAAFEQAANDMRPMLRSMISRGEAAEIVRRAARAALENKND